MSIDSFNQKGALDGIYFSVVAMVSFHSGDFHFLPESFSHTMLVCSFFTLNDVFVQIFKKRHSVTFLRICSENASADHKAAKKFIDEGRGLKMAL